MGSSEELLNKINEQEVQLGRYKKKLQDLVVAHKKLITEKERLEENLKTITSTIKNPEEDVEAKSKDSNIEIKELNCKISRLAQSLSSLTDEKSKTEAEFQHERKQLVQQNVQMKEKLKSLTSSMSSNKKLQEAQVESVKTQLNLENNQRELDFSSNIRELQNIITEERRKREEKDNTIENLQEQLQDMMRTLNESRENEQELQKQLNYTQKQLETENAPQMVMEKLKRELQIMKEQHNYTVHQQQTRALKAEDRARRLTIEHEHRVSKLEQKLAQFSDLASNYDKHRQEDQQTIMKLKNRLMQLELENSNNKCEDDRLPANEETLIQQLQHVKHQLILNCKTSNQLNNLKELLLDGLEGVSNEDLKYKQQYSKLKQQFEEYMQQVTRNHDIKTSRHKIHNLKARISDLELTNSSLQKKLEVQPEEINELIEKERQLWKGKMNSVESNYRNKYIMLERELEKQRERLANIVEEKEKQLVDLQQHYFPSYKFPDDTSSADTKKSGAAARRQSSTLIYYLEDTARKEADIARLRKSNNELQMKLHNMEKELFLQMQLYAQSQQDISRLENQQDSAEERNNTYLKNVFHNYLMTPDSKMRSHMLNAIFAILKFSDLEMNQVLKQKQQS